MRRLLFAPIWIAPLAVMMLPAAQAADPKLLPAPYKVLPIGTVLDYKTWKCTVIGNKGIDTVCRGVGGDELTLKGKFVPSGKIPQSGYGTRLTGVRCGRQPAGGGQGSTPLDPFTSVEITEAANKTIASLWPLTVGKEVTFRKNYRPIDGKAKARIRVTGTKSVKIGDARRNVYVVKGETTAIKCSNFSGPSSREYIEEWLYDPNVGAVVSYEYEWVDHARDDDFYDYSLVSAKFPELLSIAETPMAAEPRIAHPRPVTVLPAPDRVPPAVETVTSLSTPGPTVWIWGKVHDASKIIELTVNGQAVALSENGAFQISRGVLVGTSVLTLGAVDEWGNRGTRKVTVRRSGGPDLAARATPKARLAPKLPVRDPFADMHFGAYHALVIGNNRYRHMKKLRTAENDAKTVSRVLRAEYGFKVTTLLNASRGDILGAMADMRARFKADDNLLIYYAGHGVVDSITEQGYWLPVDAENRNPANWISNGDLTTMLRGMSARHVMVVADSCYSGTLVRAASARMATGQDKLAWVKRMLGKRARTALVSGGLEPVMDGGGDGHSVFAKAFLSALRRNTSVMDGQDLFDAIKRPVILNADQTPQYNDIRRAGHDGGEFIFVRRINR